ncbi:sulfotransferase ssu-1-like [Uloborus diversus]|uniref:sulfotransferase ssu-1-like n=1 Tax=Uloborus diversus TaxID=327109 RepID=UPI002409C384|nr:sulfotransferase ssu-1-like [Uloborus diversus]
MTNAIKRPLYQTIEGLRIPSFFSPNCFKEALTYKPSSNDVFIVTYPKCGTTWMQNIVLYIFRKGQELEDTKDFIRMCPHIEEVGLEGIERMTRPGAIKTHLPYNMMPYSPEAKYIFVARDPRDCCVSLYYHTRNNLKFGYWDGQFDEFFELFMAGEVEFNDYYDHLLGLYPHRNDSQVFFTKYEDMKRNAKEVVVNLSRFLGQEYIDAIEKDNAVLNNILRFSGFDYMKKKLSHLFGATSNESSEADASKEKDMTESEKYLENFVKSLNIPENPPQLEFLRKGCVGDWRNHFSPEQRDRFEAKFLERTKGTEIQEWYGTN